MNEVLRHAGMDQASATTTGMWWLLSAPAPRLRSDDILVVVRKDCPCAESHHAYAPTTGMGWLLIAPTSRCDRRCLLFKFIPGFRFTG